jgi:serine/threonine protein kinase
MKEKFCRASGISNSNIMTQSYLRFIVNMQYAFQDRENLYLVMDLLTGGDLRFHIARHRRFSEEQTRFFVASIMVSLEFIHNKSILHRDIKPENLVFDERGYLKVTDFGIARIWNPDNSKETSGTPGYMAPEVMCR